VIAAVRPNPSAAECRELEELLTEYWDIFAKKMDDYGRTERVYGHILLDAGEARRIRQNPRRLSLANQTK
jgi:hypothetical protein